jgi:hypothetical protein
MKVVFKAPAQPAEIREIEDTLACLQALVGGDIEMVSLFNYSDLPGLAKVCLILNEEGKLHNLPYNFPLGEIDCVVGNAIFAGFNASTGANKPLNDKQVRAVLTWLDSI